MAADVLNYGIGEVISHKFPNRAQKAVAHASRTFTPAEKNYGQIEKEALALLFAVEMLHKLLHDRQLTLLTGHKPLLSIWRLKRALRHTPPANSRDEKSSSSGTTGHQVL